MTGYFSKVKQFVDEEFRKAGRPDHLEHLARTVHWIKQLEPDATDALKIAGYAHDMEHAERWQQEDKSDNADRHEKKNFTDPDRLESHQERSAEIVASFLEDSGAPRELVEKVRELVRKHEEGGTPEQDILKDADSLSFFECNVDIFLDATGKVFRKQDVREKYDWMFKRISSEEAREIAEPWYREAIEKLEEQ
ncbi:MAG: DUF4202 family protein [Candidatus Nanohaloarchaea archaeon]